MYSKRKGTGRTRMKKKGKKNIKMNVFLRSV